MCKTEGCKKKSLYNFNGERPQYCGTCRIDGMVDVKHKRCLEPGCNTRPTYNNEGQTTAIYCMAHKKKGMIDVISKRCLEDGCKTRPVYNVEGQETAIYCAVHKKEGMINVNDKHCLEPGCKTLPTYNIEGQTTAIYCVAHKKEGMINVKDKRCLEPGCDTRPTYNIEGQKLAIYCAAHKKEGMINVKDKHCLEDGCKTRPSYNVEGQTTAIYCVAHKKEGMINVKDKRCKTHLCYTLVKNKYRGYCLRCFTYLFPNEPNSRNYKTKEFATTEFIKSHLSELPWIFDKMISGGCSRRRPDVFADLGSKVIIIEIDENMHMGYECENRRLMEISQDVAHRPVIFIRFNPDDYVKQTGERITSCWGVNKNGVCCVKKKKIDEWNNRLETLVRNIKYWVETDSDKTIEVVQLFYS